MKTDDGPMIIVTRVQGYLYGLEMPNGHQLPVGVYRVKKAGRKQWNVVDLLTGLAWNNDMDDTNTLDSADKLIVERCVKRGFDVLMKQDAQVLCENKTLYNCLMSIGEFSQPERVEPLRVDNLPQSCSTFDSEGLRRVV